MPDTPVDLLQVQLKAVRARWTAGITSVSGEAAAHRKARLGLLLDAQQMNRIQQKLATPRLGSVSFAPQRDWRNNNGGNWITPVKDQGVCSSCVACATVAVMESRGRIQYNAPDWNVDLSEAELFFCGSGRSCSTGWWPTNALEWASTNGVCADDLFPYVDHDVDCVVPQGRSGRLMTVTKWAEVTDVGERKKFLDTTGPMIACMAVYSDLYHYVSGVYNHVSGDLVGYHAVCCVGYNEAEGYWIFKNSWGPGWGEQGFCNIAYGECDMESRFAMYGVASIDGTLRPDSVNPEPQPQPEPQPKPEPQPAPEPKPDPNVDSGQAPAQRVVLEQSVTSDRQVLWAQVGDRWFQTAIDHRLTNVLPVLFASDRVTISWKGSAVDRILAEKNLRTE